MTLIAIEEHWIMPELTSALKALPRPDESLAFNEMGEHRQRLEDLGQGRIAAMDAQGIDVSILALTPPGTHPLPPDQALRLSRAANDTAILAAGEYPTRLRALSTLPMSAPQHVADELVRAAGQGHVGTMACAATAASVSSTMQPTRTSSLLPRTWASRSSSTPRSPRTRYATPPTAASAPSPTSAWPPSDGAGTLKTATAALRLVARAPFDRHPELQIVLGHWGEMLLFWLDRANSLSRIAGLQEPVTHYIRTNFHITASGMLNPALLHHALSVTTTDRLIFSTDYPFQHPTRDEITTFLTHFTTGEDRQKFTTTNAAALYGLEL